MNWLNVIHEFNDFIETVNDKKCGYFRYAVKIDFDGTYLSRLIDKETEEYYYWNKPSEGISFFAGGKINRIKAAGAGRLTESEKQIPDDTEFYDNFRTGMPVFPLYLGGIGFTPIKDERNREGFSDSDWFIPRYIFYIGKEASYFVFNFKKGENKELLKNLFFELTGRLSANGSDTENINSNTFSAEGLDDPETRSSWRERVDYGLELINKKILNKIVLSRKVVIKIENPDILPLWLEKLAADFPGCYIFAFKSESSVFFGATPEKLAVIKDNILYTDALAGSLPRGADEVTDKQLAENLLSDVKNCAEHKAVVDYIVNSLDGLAVNIKYRNKPVIKKLANIQHLWTPVEAELKDGISVFGILKALHPTPAICGSPWKIARDYIEKIEPFERGLFTGVTGWFDNIGNAEFVVGIRSAFLSANNLYCYAGCGIVEGSDPDTEFEESMLKLSPILGLLEYDKVHQP